MANDVGFGAGLKSLREGLSFLKNQKSLWVYAILPTIINVILLFISIYLVIHFIPGLFSWITSKISFLNIDTASLWFKLLIPIIWLVKLILFLVFLMFALITCFVVGMIISGPFNDLLSEKTEMLIVGKENVIQTPLIKSIIRSVIVETQKALAFIALPLLMFVLNLIPVVGIFVYFVLLNIFAMFDLGFAYLDYPMSRRNWKFSQRIQFVWKNKQAVFVLGSIILIPFLAYFINSILVVSGTILFNKIERSAKEG